VQVDIAHVDIHGLATGFSAGACARESCDENEAQNTHDVGKVQVPGQGWDARRSGWTQMDYKRRSGWDADGTQITLMKWTQITLMKWTQMDADRSR
jgi:hypothetical protein